MSLIVLTADHGGMSATKFHGVDTAARSDFNWYYGKEARTRTRRTWMPRPP
jgi:hypothetical protein